MASFLNKLSRIFLWSMGAGGIIILYAFYKSSGEGHHLSKVTLQKAVHYVKFRASLQLLPCQIERQFSGNLAEDKTGVGDGVSGEWEMGAPGVHDIKAWATVKALARVPGSKNHQTFAKSLPGLRRQATRFKRQSTVPFLFLLPFSLAVMGKGLEVPGRVFPITEPGLHRAWQRDGAQYVRTGQ